MEESHTDDWKMDCSHGRHRMGGMPKLYSTGNLKCPRIHAKWFSLNRSHQPLSFTSVYFWFKVPYNRKGERSQQLCSTLRIKPCEVPQNKVTSRGQTWATTIKFTWHLITHKDFPPCRFFQLGEQRMSRRSRLSASRCQGAQGSLVMRRWGITGASQLSQHCNKLIITQ